MSSNRNMNSSMDLEHMRDLVTRRFAEAHIPLVWADSPLEFDGRLRVSRDNPVFMMDVRRKHGRTRAKEHILIHYGNGTEVQVLDVDTAQQQVVLRVYEPQSTLEQGEWDPKLQRRVLRQTTVPESTRSLLVGMDECHLFVCALQRNASSVREAHRNLQPDVVRSKRRKRSKRQGEWFFVPVDDAEVLGRIAEIVALAGPGRRVPVGWAVGARPHVADEWVHVRETVYVRGNIRHPDHRVLKLNGWHEVHLNTESRAARIDGMTWLD